MKKGKKKEFFSTKLGKIMAIAIALVLIVSLAIPAFAAEKPATGSTFVYMTEPSEVSFSVKVDPQTSPEDYDFYLGDKKIGDWKKWSMETGDFTGGEYITFGKDPVIENAELKVTFAFDLLFDSTDLSLRRPKNIRLAYPKMIGDYVLKAVDKNTGKEYTKKITLRPYESYLSYDEMQAEIQNIKKAASEDRYVEIEQYGTSVQGRPLYYGVVAQSKKALDKYLNETTPMMLNKPEEFLSLIENNKADYKQVVLINNIHPDEEPAVDAVVELFRTFATKNNVSYNTTDENGKALNKKININKALDDIIFVFSFTMNPDGRAENTRTNANGFDLNRDNGYQTQPETKAINQVTVKFNPSIFIDYHGFVSEFLIEPCTPPHEPNYETDILLPVMLENAHRMGRAGVAASKYDGYIIPMIDYKTGWDDATSAYTPMFAMFHGAVGHTIEVPEMNQESFKAALGTGYAAVDFLMEDKEMFMKNKLNYFLRGIRNEDNREADKLIINAKGEVKGRPRGANENFFPDYYVIPRGLDTQKNTVAAYDIAEYMNRNGIKVSQLKEDFAPYHKGDMVIDMAQAKRGFINHILYSGVNESEWDEMYAEIVVNMPVMRGFDAIEIRNKDLFRGKLTDLVMENPATSEVTEGKYFVIENNSNEAVKAVNQAIAKGEKVSFLSGRGFGVEKSTLDGLTKDFALKFKAVENNPGGKALTKPSVYIDGSKALKLAMTSIGFDLKEKPEEAAIIVTDSGDVDPEIIGTKPVVLIGGQAAAAVSESGVIPGLEVKTTDFYHEGLLKAEVSPTLISTGYPQNDIMYTVSGSWIEKLPESFQSVIQVKNDSKFFVAGWWPGNEQVKGKTMAAIGKVNGQPVVIFAGNPTNKLHPEYLFRWVSNAIYTVE